MWRALKTLIKIAVYLAIILIGLLLLSAAFHQRSTSGILIGVFLCLLGFVGFVALFWGRRWWGTVTFVISLLIVVFGCGVFLLVPRPMAHAPIEIEPPAPAERPVILKKIETTATGAANNAVAEYRKPEHTVNKARAIASLSSVSNQLRSLQATARAADPGAIKETVRSASVSESVTEKVAPAVADAVTEAIQKGVPADAANEAAARGLDKAATAPSEVDRLLDEMQSANIAFNVPSSLGYGRTSGIKLELSAKKAPEELAGMIHEPGATETASVKISNEMDARLTGEGFQITAVRPERQAVSANGVTQWNWDIKPKQLGPQRLHLTLDAVMKIDNHESTYTLQTFDRTIGVNVVWPETLISFFGKYWQWVCTAVVFPVVAWLAKRIFKG
jgi:hypothetical protein